MKEPSQAVVLPYGLSSEGIVSGHFCQVCAELADEGTLGILQFPQCCRGLRSELCKHVVSYWSLSRGGRGKGGEEGEREGRTRKGKRENVRGGRGGQEECFKTQGSNYQYYSLIQKAP